MLLSPGRTRSARSRRSILLPSRKLSTKPPRICTEPPVNSRKVEFDTVNWRPALSRSANHSWRRKSRVASWPVGALPTSMPMLDRRSRFQRRPIWPPHADQVCADALASAFCAVSMTPENAATGAIAAATSKANA